MNKEWKFIFAVILCIAAVWSPYNMGITVSIKVLETMFITVWFPFLYWVLYGRGS